jgi:hypothetical protein
MRFGLFLSSLAFSAALAVPRLALADDAPPPPKDTKSDDAAKGDKPEQKQKADDATKPAKADDDSTEPVVHRYPPTGVRWGLIVGGATITLGAYAATLAAGFGWPDVPGADQLKIPFAGPWMALANNACGAQNPDCGALLYIRGALEVLSGIVQVAGLPLIGEGIFMTTEAPSKTAPSSDKPPEKASLGPQTIGIAPMLSPTVVGVGVGGTF